MALKYSLKVNRSMIVNNLAYIFYFHSILIFTHIYIYHPKLFIPLYIYIYVYKSFVVLVRVYMREILEYILTIIRYKMKSFSKNHSMNLLSIEDKRWKIWTVILLYYKIIYIPLEMHDALEIKFFTYARVKWNLSGKSWKVDKKRIEKKKKNRGIRCA